MRQTDCGNASIMDNRAQYRTAAHSGAKVGPVGFAFPDQPQARRAEESVEVRQSPFHLRRGPENSGMRHYGSPAIHLRMSPRGSRANHAPTGLPRGIRTASNESYHIYGYCFMALCRRRMHPYCRVLFRQRLRHGLQLFQLLRVERGDKRRNRAGCAQPRQRR